MCPISARDDTTVLEPLMEDIICPLQLLDMDFGEFIKQTWISINLQRRRKE
jgi:hypothetical protein